MSEPHASGDQTGRGTADVVAARATGVGAGLVAFMVLWLVGNRVTGVVWAPPAGPVLAMTVAVLGGIFVGWLMGRRLVRSLH